MGLFDYVHCKYKHPDIPDNAEHLQWQSKNTPNQYMDTYEVRADGTLWVEAYNSEWVEEPERPIFGGYIKQNDKRWEQVILDGEISLHTYVTQENNEKLWYDIIFWFREGKVKDVVVKTAPL